jgi:hypothetical protein
LCGAILLGKIYLHSCLAKLTLELGNVRLELRNVSFLGSRAVTQAHLRQKREDGTCWVMPVKSAVPLLTVVCVCRTACPQIFNQFAAMQEEETGGVRGMQPLAVAQGTVVPGHVVAQAGGVQAPVQAFTAF